MSAARPLNPRDLKDQAHVLVLRGKLDAAASLIHRHLQQRDTRDPALWMQHADLSRKLGRYDVAIVSYRQCVRLFRTAGHLTRARAALTVALQLAPRDPSLLADQALLAELPPPPRPRLVYPPPRKAPEPTSRDRVTRIARPHPPAALDEVMDAPTDPYCPLFDWLDEDA